MKLHELCLTIVDCEHKTAPTTTTGHPSIRTPNIGPGYFILDGVNRVSRATYEAWTRRTKPMPGDLIMAREAPVGNVAMIPEGMEPCLGQRTLLIRANPAWLNSRFLVYLLISPAIQSQIHGKTNGATVAHLNMSDVRNLELSEVPPIPVQRRIASILSAYDDLIENNRKRIAILEEMARRLYREWFVHFRYPGHESIPLVDSPLGRIPQGWDLSTIAAQSSLLNRGISPSYVDGGGTLVLNQKCIRDQRVDLGPARRQNKSIPNEKRIRFGDVLINSTGVGTLGRVAQIYFDPPEGTVDSHVTIARPGQISPCVWGLMLMDRQAAFERAGIGATGQTELSRGAIGSETLVVPTQSIQDRFVAIADPWRRLTVNLQCQIVVLRRTRDLLLPRLMSGQLSVTAAEAAVP